MSCEQKAIRAHSIQNARVIDPIATKGHVIALRPSFRAPGLKSSSNPWAATREASTFTGLCTVHDAKLFAPIDTKEFNDHDRQQLFLLAYRSVTRELHAVMEGALKIQSTYASRVERAPPVSKLFFGLARKIGLPARN
jgi:hypothetical protein